MLQGRGEAGQGGRWVGKRKQGETMAPGTWHLAAAACWQRTSLRNIAHSAPERNCCRQHQHQLQPSRVQQVAQLLHLALQPQDACRQGGAGR
jgi:hypothetical protein